MDGASLHILELRANRAETIFLYMVNLDDLFLRKKIECDARSGTLVARTSYSYIQSTRQKTRHMAAGSGREGNGEKEKKEGSKPHTAKQDAKAEAAASRATM